MTDQPPAPPPAPAGSTAPPAGGSGDGDRLGRLEERVEQLAETVGKLVPGSHAEAQQRTGQRLDAPSTVQEQVRAELARAKQEEQDQAAAAAAQSEQQQIREELARLRETPPAAPVPRRTRLLGWGD